MIQIGGVYTTLCQKEGILLQKYRDRNGRCIAILFKSIRVRGRCDSPEILPHQVFFKGLNETKRQVCDSDGLAQKLIQPPKTAGKRPCNRKKGSGRSVGKGLLDEWSNNIFTNPSASSPLLPALWGFHRKSDSVGMLTVVVLARSWPNLAKHLIFTCFFLPRLQDGLPTLRCQRTGAGRWICNIRTPQFRPSLEG